MTPDGRVFYFKFAATIMQLSEVLLSTEKRSNFFIPLFIHFA
jgi:hypothetical protein